MPLFFGTSITLERSISERVLQVTGRELAQRTFTWKIAGIVVTQVVLCIFFDVWKSLDPTLLLKEYLSFVHSFIHSFLPSRNIYGECANVRHYSGCWDTTVDPWSSPLHSQYVRSSGKADDSVA